MKKLIIDEGNTRVKYAVFEGDKILIKLNDISISRLNTIASSCDRIIISSVLEESSLFNHFKDRNILIVDSSTKLPIKISYETPKTLGNDRKALVVGANQLFPNQDVLVIDLGSCITFDFINSENTYVGGSISPGIKMRYKSLNQYTSKLPMIDVTHSPDLIGINTYDCIHSGVHNGVLGEINYQIQSYSNIYPKIKIIITGGDFNLFDMELKNSIFADPNLLMKGLNKILDYNESYF